MPLLLALLACAPDDTVVLKGSVYASRTSVSTLSGATVTLFDYDGERLDRVQTDLTGRFVARVPAGTNLFARIEAQGYVASLFPGVTGLEQELSIEDGALYGVTTAEHLALLDTWAGCPGLEPDGMLVVGEVRVWGIADPVTGESPTTAQGVVESQPLKGRGTEACYLDAETLVYDPAATRTGETGAFALAGLEPGIGDLAVSSEFATDAWVFEEYPLWVPPGDGPVVAPWYPAWVSWPF